MILITSVFLFFQASVLINQDKESQVLAPKNGTFFKIENENIFIQETGPQNGPALLFIHGTGSWSDLWQPTMKILAAKGFHCIAVDLPPFGFSFAEAGVNLQFDRHTQAKRLIGVLKSLKINKVTLIGHSFGGRATLTTAFTVPEKITQVVLVDAALGFGEQGHESDPAPAPVWLAHILKTDYLRNTMGAIGTFPPLTRKFVELFVADPQSVTDEITAVYQRPLYVQGKAELMAGWLKDFLLSEDNELVQNLDLYKKFAPPVHIIWGDLDSITPLWQAEHINRMFKTADVSIIKGVGHIPMIENEEAFFKTLENILVKKPIRP